MKPNIKLGVSVAANVLLVMALALTAFYHHFKLHYYQDSSGMLMRRVVALIEDGRGVEAARVLKTLPDPADLVELASAINELAPGKDLK